VRVEVKSLIKWGLLLQGIHKFRLMDPVCGSVVKDCVGVCPPERGLGCASIYVGGEVSVPQMFAGGTPDG
jgi:hypothetical protein